ncbi:FlgT C-terminal domain-containing protein [Thermodesulfobacterium hydrogeniphilum]|uniref:FlgT C-terminal domain-containing protein n=1 Tax=Thermodesulfobacterium hydrogeniphilum TaxID=161156 RepID=UPI0005715AD6|nr:FlgT C-terminal domain-containing protein [Thermodesulfobacterium hydrogeniphilum]
MKYKIVIFLLGVFIFLFCKNSWSDIPPKVYEQIKKDFTPISAFIIGSEEGEIIIDKGAAQGVKPKDIFSVYKLEKKITDPRTGKTLGFLKKFIGKIEITHVDENFATAKIISQKEKFPIPTPIKRFTDLKILVISEKPNPDENLLLILKTNLPECEIIFNPNLKLSQISFEYLLSNKIDLVFVEDENIIKVYNYKLDLIRYYGGFSYKPITHIPAITYNYQPSQDFQILKPSLLGKMKKEVIQSEFTDLDNDGIPEMVYFNDQGLFIVKIKDGLLAKYKPQYGKILNFSVGPSGWIALNIYDERVGMRSEILKYTSKGLVPVITNINLILNFIDYTARGVKDTLIGQTFDSEKFFGKDVYILKRENDKLIYAMKLDLPENYKNIGSSFVDLDRDGKPEILNYLPDGKLGIYKNNDLVWETPYPVADHFYNIKLVKGKPSYQIIKQIVKPLITPVIADLNKDGIPDVLFVSNKFPLKTVKSDLKYIPLNSATSQIFVLSFKGTYFYKNITNAQTGFITGIGVVNHVLYFTNVKGKYPGQTESELYFSYF